MYDEFHNIKLKKYKLDFFPKHNRDDSLNMTHCTFLTQFHKCCYDKNAASCFQESITMLEWSFARPTM